MANNDPSSSSGNQNQDESLSATGMFLRAFDKQTDEPASEKEVAGAASASKLNDAGSPGVAGISPSQAATQKPGSGGGEFTQMFQTLGGKPSATEGDASRPSSPAVPPKQSSSPDATAGEFTRILSGSGSGSSGGASQRPGASPVPASRSKGFSTPGSTESASAGGSFTQFFKATPAAPKPMPPVSAEPVTADSAWKPEPAFKPAETTPSANAPSGSVTSILSSLASPSRETSSPRESEPVAYRATPSPSSPPTNTVPAASGGDAGGVTRLIKKLAQEPVAAPPPPPSAPVVVASSEPSEFTRMISKIGGGANPQAGVDLPAAPAPAAAAAPAVSVQFQAPAMPQAPHIPPVAPVAPVAAAGTPKVSAQVAVAHPQAPVLPPAPKIAPPPAPALAIGPPKSKLEALVPMLLVINTFLLLIVLVVLIFLIKAK